MRPIAVWMNLVLGLTVLPVVPQEITVDLPGEESMELVWIEPGTFVMGSPEDEDARWPNEAQHIVTISRGFYLGKYEVTQAQWEALMGTEPSGESRANPTHSWHPTPPAGHRSYRGRNKPPKRTPVCIPSIPPPNAGTAWPGLTCSRESFE